VARDDLWKRTVIHDKNGNVVKRSEEAVPSTVWPGDWVRFEAKTAHWIRKHRKKWSMTDVAVLFTMIEHVGEHNLAQISAIGIADMLETTLQVVSRSLKKFTDIAWVERLGPNLYRVDLDLCWRGQTGDRFEHAKAQNRIPGELFREMESRREEDDSDDDRRECDSGDG
jgi:hypothetical protein